VLNRIAKVLSEKDRIVISTHVNPDGDAIGSSLALRLALEGMGKTAWCIHPDATPEALSFLDPEGTILVYDPESCASIFEQAQIHCTVDVSEPKRIGPVWESVQAASLTKVIIDHHPNGTAAVDYAYIQPEASATGVLIYRLLEEMGRPLTPRIADCLYAAIMTDTGGFRFSNTDPETFRIAATLVEAGAAPQDLYSAVYEKDSISRFRLFQKVILTAQFDLDNRLAWMICPKYFFEQTGTTNVELENVVNYPRNLRDVEVSILFSEPRPGHIRISLRSKNFVAVNQLAAKFGGGGHARAAGATLDGMSLEEAQAKVLEVARAMLRESEAKRENRPE